MAWTTPGTATAGSVLTASFWNTQVRDNLLALPRGYVAQTTLATSFSTSSTSYVDVTGLSVTFTAEANRRYQVMLFSSVGNAGGVTQVVINNTVSDIAEWYASVANLVTTGMTFAVTTPSAGSVTYKARIKTNSGTISIYGTNTRAEIASRMLVLDLGSTV